MSFIWFSLIFSFFKSKSPLLKGIKDRFGIKPKKRGFYEEAVRHRSIVQNKKSNSYSSNERLEFLGDAVLDVAISHYLYSNYPEQQEGYLSKLKSNLVSREKLNELALRLKIDRIAQYEIDSTSHSETILGNTFEAILGAIYLDLGYDQAYKAVVRIYEFYIDWNKVENEHTDPKSEIIEWGQKNKRDIDFKTEEIANKESNTKYKAFLIIDQEKKTEAKGRSKKNAEKKAASEFLKKINN